MDISAIGMAKYQSWVTNVKKAFIGVSGSRKGANETSDWCKTYLSLYNGRRGFARGRIGFEWQPRSIPARSASKVMRKAPLLANGERKLRLRDGRRFAEDCRRFFFVQRRSQFIRLQRRRQPGPTANK